ncbi:hypothetical protein LAZ67_8002884 [Cordylochernes scorpioides]|uniref:Uncharacterized protein n=1 Tax=Cordylochernes scorpioides TaxID=51811 RepID=A0ABY6KUG8_9ARAC|nr:hypothetical protein LAZ67_8002884 [Cordylochernes scorpioides]
MASYVFALIGTTPTVVHWLSPSSDSCSFASNKVDAIMGPKWLKVSMGMTKDEAGWMPPQNRPEPKTRTRSKRFIYMFNTLSHLLVASASKEHDSHLRAFLSRLDQFGLRINQATTSVTFLDM